jgi:serine/threonine protein kinase
MAVVLYEMITGERLFVSAGLTSTPEQIYSQPVPMLSRKIEGLPADLDKVMLRALAIDPAARYQTAGELQEALLRVAHKHGLLMSAPELSAHLRKVVGPHEKWRELDAHEGTAGPRGGTEVYDMGPEGTYQLSVDDLDDDDFGSSDLSSGLSAMRGARAKTSITHRRGSRASS